MPSAVSKDTEYDHITELLSQAETYARQGRKQDAQTLIRQALSIDSKDARCGEALKNLAEQDTVPTENPLQLVTDYLAADYGRDAKQVARAVASASPTPEDAGKMVSMLLESTEKQKEAEDLLPAVLTLLPCQKVVVDMLSKDVTSTFKSFWALGQQSMRALALGILLTPQAWPSESERAESENGVLLLLFAKLLEPAVDNDGLLVAHATIARLFDQDAPSLQSHVGPDEFDSLLIAIRISNPLSIRSEATRAVVKLLDADDARFQKFFGEFIVRKTATQKKADLIIALSAAGRLFAVTRAVAVELLLSGDTLESLQGQVAKLRSSDLTLAYLELLSAACADGACRQAIGKSCASWLAETANSDSSHSSKAALVLSKAIGLPNTSKSEVQNELAALADSFKDMILSEEDDDKKQDAIEGLAYQSRNAKVKQDLASRTNVMKAIMEHLMHIGATGPAVYGGLTIFLNMTTYPPPNAAEQAKMAKLKAYANQTTPELPDPLDGEDYVSTRCRKVLDAGIAPLLVQATKKATPAILTLISTITLSISKHPKHRGPMVQQGLLDNALRLSISDLAASGVGTIVQRQSALAFARCIIPIDPHLVFQKRSVEAAMHPLKLLLQVPTTAEDDEVTERWWRMFPVRESLRALTNIATLQTQDADPSAGVQGMIMNSCWDLIEDHWTADMLEVRRAATELILNMSASPLLLQKFIDPAEDAAAPRRMQILAAYWGDDSDVGLRLAAGGALATLLEGAAYEGTKGIEQFFKTENGLKYTAEAIESGTEGFLARALAILQGIVLALRDGEKTLKDTTWSKLAAAGIPTAMAKLRKDGPMKEQAGQIIEAMKDVGISQ